MNNKFLFYDLMFLQNADPFGFNDVRFVSSYNNNPGTGASFDPMYNYYSFPQHFAWLFDPNDCKPGDYLFLIIAADGVFTGPSELSSALFRKACEALPGGVSVIYYTGACGCACIGNMPYHFKINSGTNGAVVPSNCECTFCATQDNGSDVNYQQCMSKNPNQLPCHQDSSTPIAASVVTIEEHENACSGSWSYCPWAQKYPQTKGVTMCLMAYAYLHLGDLKNVTLRQFMLKYFEYNKSNPDWTPIVGLSDPLLLDKVFPLYMDGYAVPDRNYMIPADLLG
jgi:hypothetical protein